MNYSYVHTKTDFIHVAFKLSVEKIRHFLFKRVSVILTGQIDVRQLGKEAT